VVNEHEQGKTRARRAQYEGKSRAIRGQDETTSRRKPSCFEKKKVAAMCSVRKRE
jgi:hypothetical protein